MGERGGDEERRSVGNNYVDSLTQEELREANANLRAITGSFGVLGPGGVSEMVQRLIGPLTDIAGSSVLPKIDARTFLPGLTALAQVQKPLVSAKFNEDVQAIVAGLARPVDVTGMLPAVDAQVRGIVSGLSTSARLSALSSIPGTFDQDTFLPALSNLSAYATASGKIGDIPAITRRWAEVLPLAQPRLFNEGLADSLRSILERVQPRNLRGVSGLDTDKIDQVMAEEGIPFFLVPDGDTALALLAAPDAAGRRAVMKQRAEDILHSCEPILALCVDPEIAYLGAMARSAIVAYRDGHPHAAQALATNVLDSTLQRYEGKTHRKYIVGRLTLKGGLNGIAYAQETAAPAVVRARTFEGRALLREGRQRRLLSERDRAPSHPGAVHACQCHSVDHAGDECARIRPGPVVSRTARGGGLSPSVACG